MPLQFGRGAFIKLGEESTYGNIAGSMVVDNRIISASFQKTQEKERHIYLNPVAVVFKMDTLKPF